MPANDFAADVIGVIYTNISNFTGGWGAKHPSGKSYRTLPLHIENTEKSSSTQYKSFYLKVQQVSSQD